MYCSTANKKKIPTSSIGNRVQATVGEGSIERTSKKIRAVFKSITSE